MNVRLGVGAIYGEFIGPVRFGCNDQVDFVCIIFSVAILPVPTIVQNGAPRLIWNFRRSHYAK